MSTTDHDVARKEAQLPGAFPDTEDAIVRETGGISTQEPTTTTGPGLTTSTGARTQVDPNATDLTEDVRRFAAGAVSAATAVGLAAKDAALAAKDAAMPTANAASEQASNAATYARDSVTDAANSARANAPGILPGTNANTANQASTTHDTSHSIDETSSGIPTEVRDSIIKSGQAPEAAADRQAVQDKSRVEEELLASVTTSQAGSGDSSRGQIGNHQANSGTQAPVGSSSSGPGLTGSAANRPFLYSQDTGSFREPGTAVVLGTDTERAFPLGVPHHAESTPTATSTSVPDFAELPNVAGGLETREAAQSSTGTGTGREADYTHGSHATSHADNAGSGFGSADQQVPRSSFAAQSQDSVPAREHESTHTHGNTIQDRLPVRDTEEPTVGNGPGAYKTLGSGTPSGVNI